MRTALGGNTRDIALFDEFRQRWSTLLLTEHLVRQHESALLTSYEKLHESNLTTPHRKLVNAAINTVCTARQDPNSHQHPQIGLRLGTPVNECKERCDKREDVRPNELPDVAPVDATNLHQDCNNDASGP